jgi:hypothetical protein
VLSVGVCGLVETHVKEGHHHGSAGSGVQQGPSVHAGVWECNCVEMWGCIGVGVGVGGVYVGVGVPPKTIQIMQTIRLNA